MTGTDESSDGAPQSGESASSALLPAGVALQLAHAVAQFAAGRTGARIVIVKGLAAARLGLRLPWTGADVDVMVDPVAFDSVISVLRGSGWHPRPADDDTLAFPTHSVSLTHERWSCDLDMHFRFPGFERSDAEVFEQLWAHRVEVEVAGVSVAVTDDIDTILTLALHDLRNPRVRRHRDDLVRLSRHAEALEIGQVIERAEALGALACARPFLEPLAHRAALPPPAWGTASREWQLRTLDPLARRLVFILDGTYRRHGVDLRRLVAPPRTTLVKDGLPHSRPAPWEVVRGYARRWLRGIRHAPAAAWAAVRFLAGGRG